MNRFQRKQPRVLLLRDMTVRYSKMEEGKHMRVSSVGKVFHLDQIIRVRHGVMILLSLVFLSFKNNNNKWQSVGNDSPKSQLNKIKKTH